MDKHETLDVLKAHIHAIESKQEGNSVVKLSHQAPQCANDALDCSVFYEPQEDTKENTEGISHKKCASQSAFSKIAALINASEKPACEIRKRLVHAGYEASEIENALTRAIECGLVDDLRYARILIQSRISQGWGSEGIERELLRNDIDPSNIEGWPFEFPFSYDEEVLRGLDFLKRKPPRSRNLRDGAYRKLINRGYASSIASQVAGLWYEEINK